MDFPREFPGCDSIEDVQQKFFRQVLPNMQSGRYLYRKRGLQAKPNTVVLFQCKGQIIEVVPGNRTAG